MSDFLSPGRIEEVMDLVTSLGAGWILVLVFVSMFVENVFPPYPGDAVLFAAGFIAGSGIVSIPFLIAVSVLGSISSILIVYWLGRRFGRSLFRTKKLGFLHPERLPKIENWFARYGDFLLLASRFLAGTRSLIILSAGIGGIKTARMAILSGISVIVWNCMVILSAYYLHSNWEAVYDIFSTYNRVVLIIIVCIAVCYLLRLAFRRFRKA